MHRTFSAAPKNQGSRAAITDGEQTGSVLDELSLEDSKAYQAKVTKYKQSALNCSADPLFWTAMRLAHVTRGPLLHFYRILNKLPEKGDMPIVNLVGRNLARLQSEFTELVRSSEQWVAEAVREGDVRATATACVAVNEKDAANLAMLLLLHCAAAFDRRVVKPLNRTDSHNVIGESCFGSPCLLITCLYIHHFIA